MKRHLILLFVGVSLPFLLAAQQKNSVSITKRVLRIPEVTVVGKRPMKDIGVQRTRFDSIAMKENIALSMADVLTFNSSVFVKNYGRATLSTVAFRGTSPSHTQVTWNGMRINNPMLGMTDFSTIPSYFIDDASLLHGTSSVNETGGGLGGLVRLSTSPANHEGFGLQYVQGVGSFSTFDEFLRLPTVTNTGSPPPVWCIPLPPTTTNTETGTRRKTSMTRTRTSSVPITRRNATAAGLIRICTSCRKFIITRAKATSSG